MQKNNAQSSIILGFVIALPRRTMRSKETPFVLLCKKQKNLGILNANTYPFYQPHNNNYAEKTV